MAYYINVIWYYFDLSWKYLVLDEYNALLYHHCQKRMIYPNLGMALSMIWLVMNGYAVVKGGCLAAKHFYNNLVAYLVERAIFVGRLYWLDFLYVALSNY